MVLDSSISTPNNSLATKIKNLDGHVTENWTPIEIQLDIDFLISTLNNLLCTKLKFIYDMWHKIENPIKI